MEVSALNSGDPGPHKQSPLLRLQSDENLIKLIRRGNDAAFAVLVQRYQPRLLAFCRMFLGSTEDAEDALQETLTGAYNAIRADERPINVRPWLYRIARNRCLNHLRRAPLVGVDSMDIHLAEHGTTTADKVHQREDFRRLVHDIHALPESQRTALVLREMDALSYEQIADTMETSISSVKSLLVRARVSLAAAAEAAEISCETVRTELAEMAEGTVKRLSPAVRKHLRDCDGCTAFDARLKANNRALRLLLPIAPVGFALTRVGALKSLLGGSKATGGGGGAGATAAAGAAVATAAVVAAAATLVVTSGSGHRARHSSAASARLNTPRASGASPAKVALVPHATQRGAGAPSSRHTVVTAGSHSAATPVLTSEPLSLTMTPAPVTIPTTPAQSSPAPTTRQTAPVTRASTGTPAATTPAATTPAATTPAATSPMPAGTAPVNTTSPAASTPMPTTASTPPATTTTPAPTPTSTCPAGQSPLSVPILSLCVPTPLYSVLPSALPVATP